MWDALLRVKVRYGAAAFSKGVSCMVWADKDLLMEISMMDYLGMILLKVREFTILNKRIHMFLVNLKRMFA